LSPNSIKNMNIGVNCREMLAHRMEGICRYITETTRQMVLSHPDDTFYFFFDRPYDHQFIFADNIVPVVIGLQARHPVLWYLWFEQSLPKALKKYKIDVLYSGDNYLSLKTKVPTLLVCHDLAYKHYPDHIKSSHRKYFEKNFPKFHKRADHIVTVSEYTRQDVIKTYNIDSKKVTVGYNATPPGFRELSFEEKKAAKLKFTDGNPYYLFVGSLHPRKNLVRLIKAFEQFKKLKNNTYKLVLVGRFGWKNKELKSTYDNLMFKTDIILTGTIQEGIQDVIGGSEGLFYVSLFEGFGIPILEGFSAKVPVVTSTVSSMPEVADKFATLVDPTDINAITDAMVSLIEKPPTKSALDAAYKRAKTFTWKRTADHIYERLMKISTSS